MKIIKNIGQMQSFAGKTRESGKTIGFVPTMGFLHDGHLELMRVARSKCDILVVSIFVNPLQFGQGEDFGKYPRDFERDESLCKREKVDVIFYPSNDLMYPQPYYTYVEVEKLTRRMCGASRPGHFRGVTTIVAKLFNIVKPNLAVFGEKDFQQARIIKQMVLDLNYDIEILTAPIVREVDGLALSSRNRYLGDNARQRALVLSKSLKLASELAADGIRSPAMIRMQIEQYVRGVPGVSIDYIEIADADTLEPVSEIRDNTLVALAVYIGSVRLIDNTVIKLKPESGK